MKKILMINSLDITYGSTHRFRKFYQFIKESGYQVKYIEPNYKGHDKNIISIHQKINIIGFLIGTIIRMYYAATLKYDILFVQKFLPFTTLPVFIAHFRMKKVIVDCDDLDYGWQKNVFRKIIIKFFEEIGPYFAHTVFTHNNHLLKILKNKKRNVYLVPQGVDTTIFNKERYQKEEMRKELKIKDEFLLLYTAGFSIGGVGDFDIILEAIKMVKEKLKNVVLYVIGGGPLLKEYKSKFSSEYIKFLGYLPQETIAKYISASDICLICMRESASNLTRVSLKVLEYLSMGKTVVGSLVGATKDLFGKYCINALPNPEAIAEKIIEVINKKYICEDVSEFIKNNYSWNIIKMIFISYFSFLIKHA